jgi:CheY-like chemotaxis protein
VNVRERPHAVHGSIGDAWPMHVLIVDDDADFRRIARELLVEGGIEVVGEVADGAAAIEAVRDLQPSVVLLDIQLLDVDGFAVARRIASQQPAPVVVLTSVRDISAYRRRVALSPAVGFIAKGAFSAAALAALVRGP